MLMQRRWVLFCWYGGRLTRQRLYDLKAGSPHFTANVTRTVGCDTALMPTFVHFISPHSNHRSVPCTIVAYPLGLRFLHPNRHTSSHQERIRSTVFLFHNRHNISIYIYKDYTRTPIYYLRHVEHLPSLRYFDPCQAAVSFP
jgi:hypothetical protein